MYKIVFIGLLLVIKTSLYSQNNLNYSEVISVKEESIKKQSIYTKEIDEAFKTHYNYFKSELYRRLKKDANGWNDTYVLYDVQMHMQNAIIYADEQDNKEIIEKLLTLVLIPFEEQYMTNGKWLNNKDAVPNRPDLWGVEVELPLTQYFSLLTRVLSAAERHGISTNLTQKEIDIIVNHIDEWLNNEKLSNPQKLINDRHLFKVQSALQFAEYANIRGINIEHLETWKQIVQNYIKYTLKPKWEKVDCKDENGNVIDNCLALDRNGYSKHRDFAYAGYGSEITKTNSNNDPNAMFDTDGIVKQPKKYVNKVAMDISHARRLNWFFETVRRFGKPFDVSISDETMQGWANNLAYRVCRGTVKNPKFTIFSDGVDGWYRVNYSNRPSFGYTTGDMDLHFVASSYGMLGVYNPRIRTWMKAWSGKNKNKMDKYYGAYNLDYYTSLAIDMTLSIDKITETESFILKNPSDQFFDIGFNSSYMGEVSINIFSVEGKQIKELTFQKTNQLFNYQIDLSNQASGLYIVNFRAGSYVKVHKIIKN